MEGLLMVAHGASLPRENARHAAAIWAGADLFERCDDSAA